MAARLTAHPSTTKRRVAAERYVPVGHPLFVLAQVHVDADGPVLRPSEDAQRSRLFLSTTPRAHAVRGEEVLTVLFAVVAAMILAIGGMLEAN